MLCIGCVSVLSKVSLFYEFTKNNIPLQNDFFYNAKKYISFRIWQRN